MAVAQITLFLLPCAGASAAVFRPWESRLPAWIRPVPLTPPGRGSRFAEQPIMQWSGLVDTLMRDITPTLGTPFAIFGHSMGALVGLELAHAIRQRYAMAPEWFGAAACTAPLRRVQELKWQHATASELLTEVNRLGGTPKELLDNREMLDLLLPAIRADFHLCGSYKPQNRPSLDCPILALGGSHDDISMPTENLETWSHETTGPFGKKLMPGNHFFIEMERDAVIRLISESLAASLRSPPDGRHAQR